MAGGFLYQLRSLIAEAMIRAAVSIDPTTDRAVRLAYGDLAEAKINQVRRER
jgi:hypothetical protein